MPPILLKKFSSEIIKNIARSDVISNNNTKIISSSKKLYRRQVSINNNTKTRGTKPAPVDSIPTVTISPGGPVSYTLGSVTPTIINPTSIIPTNVIPNAPDATPIFTSINPTVTNTDIGSTTTATSTVVNESTDTTVFSTNTGVISNSGIIPTETSTLSSSIPVEQSPIPTVNTQSSSSSPSISPLPNPITSNNRPSNNLHAWLFPILAISLLITVLAFLGYIYKKKNRNRNIKNNNNYIQNVGAGDMMDKNDSKANSLTSSINSVSSFRIKRGKVVPGDIHIGSPPDPITPIVADNNDPSPIAPIVTDNNDKGKFKRPILERTPTTVSAFTELVDLTDEENDSLRQSVASRLSSTPSFVHNIENVPSNAAIPLRQERVDAVIPFSFANDGGGSSGSASGSGTRIYTTPPFDNINSDNNNDN